jgi:hypothetical protein
MFDIRLPRVFVVCAVLLSLAGCTGSAPAASIPASTSAAASDGAGASSSSASGGRPSSPAVVAIISPKAGQSVTGKTVHVVISLTGAQIVSATTTNIRPDQGHVHLYVDNALVSMNYGLEQDLPVSPGTYVLKAEFVAADHAPFDPRVISPDVFFTVK